MEYHLSFGLHKAKLPIIPIEIKEQYLCFILDTGSTCNLIDSTVVEYFKDIVEPVGDYCISGIEGTKHKVDIVALPFNFEGQIYKPKFCVKPLLGTDFLLENKWILNFNKLRVTTQ